MAKKLKVPVDVTRSFHFYAAHRNAEIGGKCANIHGHRYGLDVTVREPAKGSVTILFEELEERVKPLIEELDHSLLLNKSDPAAGGLIASGACNKIFFVSGETSAENMAYVILGRLEKLGLNVTEVVLRETDSCTVSIKK